MPIPIETIEDFQSYLNGVITRAQHHAHEVEDVILTLAGAVLLVKDPDTSIELFSREGSAANVIWVRVRGTRYAFSYDHSNRQVVIKRGSTRGNVVSTFNNQTPTRDVIDIIRRLRSN